MVIGSEIVIKIEKKFYGRDINMVLKRRARPYVNKILLICTVLLLAGIISLIYAVGKRNSEVKMNRSIEFHERV
jgi:hypothetical protein